MSYRCRILYVMSVAYIDKISKPFGLNVYVLINTLSLLMAGCYLYFLCRSESPAISLLTGVCCGISLAFFPAVLIINQVQAHPDLLAMAFLAASLFHYKKRHWLTLGLFVFVGVLVKQTVAFLIVYVVFDCLLVSLRQGRIDKVRFLMVCYLASVLLVGIFVMRKFSAGSHFDIGLYEFVWRHNFNKLFASLLANFGFFTIIIVAAFYAIRPPDLLAIAAYAGFGFIVSLFVATDFFRVFFSMLFPFTLPIAWRYVQELGTNRLTANAYFLICLYLLFLLLPIDLSYTDANVVYWKYVSVFLLLFCGEFRRQQQLKILK